MTELTAPRDNHLLSALSEEAQQRIFPHLELVTLPLGKVIYESGDTLDSVYFPTNAIVSMLYVMQNGASAEISMVGNEGMMGVALFMGGLSTPSRAVIQSAGEAYRMPALLFKQEFDRHHELMDLMLRFTQALLTQMAQTAVCNRHHSIDQQLARWILLSIDRLSGNQLNMTQELIANMLGVRREGVSEAAGKLRSKGVIEYSRGHITVLDRLRLEALTCECYGVVKRETDRLLPYSRFSQIPGLSRIDGITASISSIELRQNAEAYLKRTKVNPSEGDAKKILHELQVHQIELEMQNEELQQSRRAEMKSARRYTELFEFAPISYFVIESTGIISQLNLRGANLLGTERASLVGKPFLNYVTAQSRAVFKKFLATVFEEKGIQTCEVSVQVDQRELWLLVEANLGILDINCLTLLTDITERKQAEKKLERIAFYDSLTNLPNRVLLADRLRQAIVQSQRRNRLLAVVYMDLDGFKAVNDAHDHDAGDKLLVALSLRMKEALREGDTLARIGGDEFIAIMVDLENIEDSEIVLERLLNAAASPITLGDIVVQVSTSIGVTLYPHDDADAEQLIRHADHAMYVAKQAGKNRYHFFETPKNRKGS